MESNTEKQKLELLNRNFGGRRTELPPLRGWAEGALYCRTEDTKRMSFPMITHHNQQEGSHIFCVCKLSKTIPNEV